MFKLYVTLSLSSLLFKNSHLCAFSSIKIMDSKFDDGYDTALLEITEEVIESLSSSYPDEGYISYPREIESGNNIKLEIYEISPESTQDTESSNGLVIAVRERPALWDTNNPNYSNEAITKTMWDEIKQLFPRDNGIIIIIISPQLSTAEHNADILKNKWSNLMDHYRCELEKINQSQGDPGTAYNSTWKYFELMSFMRNQVMPTQNDTTKMDNDDYDVKDALSRIFPSVSFSTSDVFPDCPDVPGSLPVQQRRSINELLEEYLDIERRKLLILEQNLEQNRERCENHCEDCQYLMSLLPLMKNFVRNNINAITYAN